MDFRGNNICDAGVTPDIDAKVRPTNVSRSGPKFDPGQEMHTETGGTRRELYADRDSGFLNRNYDGPDQLEG